MKSTLPAPRYEARPARSFKGLAVGIDTFVSGGPLAAFQPRDFFVYGSFVRSLWTRENWADVNVAFRTAELRDAGRQRLTPAMRFSVAEELYESPDALLDEADFTVCQMVYHAGEFHFAPAWFEHVAQRLLLVNRVTPDTALVTFLRSLKLAGRGFALSFTELVRILDQVRVANLSSAGVDVLRHGGGFVVPA